MADKDVNIHVRAKEADQAKRDIDKTAQATEDLGKKTEHAGKKGAEGTDALGKSAEKTKGAFGSFMAKLSGWAVGLLGVGGMIRAVTGAVNENKRAMEEHADVAVAQQQKLLRLQYLGDLFKERPELGKEVGVLSEFGRRPFEEVADAWYNLRSKGGALSQQQRDSIMREALEMGRTDPDLPLDTLIDMFSLYAKKTGEGDANRIQNVLQQTITEAGGSGADVARHMPRFLPIGMAGKLTGPESAGLWAYATTLEGEASVATTGLRAVFMKLAGEATPEGEKIMRKLGVRSDMGFVEKIDKLSEAKAAGELPLAAAKQLVGDEGASMLLSLLTDPGAMRATMAKVVGVDKGDIDLTATKIKELLGQDELAQREDEIRRVKVEIENIKGSDSVSVQQRQHLLEREAFRRKRGDVPWKIALDRWMGELFYGMGYEGTPIPPEGGLLPEQEPFGLWDVRRKWEALRRPFQDEEGAEPPVGDPALEGEQPATDPPSAGDLQGGQSRVINYNEHYDYSIHLNPVAGNREDRLIGPPVDPYA